MRNIIPILFFTIGLMSAAFAIAANPLEKAQLNKNQEYLNQFIQHEQKFNDRTENLKEFDSIRQNIMLSPAYRPENQAVFNLPTFLIEADSVVLLKTKKIDSAVYMNQKTGLIRFFTHPQSVNAFWPHLQSAVNEGGWVATPTSSYRSILAWQATGAKKEVYGLKVSLDSEIGAISRMLSRSQIERATVTSLAIQRTSKDVYASQGIYFIDEPVSVYLKNYQFGYSIREIPQMAEGAKLVPLFALYSKQNGQSLLQTMINKSTLKAKDFIFQQLIEPLTRQSLFLGFTEGFIGAPHEQNVLVEIVNGKLSGKFYYRDLGSFHINENLRTLAGKDTSFIPKTFLPENLKGNKNNLIQSIQDYLVASQFYAMVRSLDKGQVSDRWIDEVVLDTVSKTIQKQTGRKANTWQGVKVAVTQHLQKNKCEALFFNP